MECAYAQYLCYTDVSERCSVTVTSTQLLPRSTRLWPTGTDRARSVRTAIEGYDHHEEVSTVSDGTPTSSGNVKTGVHDVSTFGHQ